MSLRISSALAALALLVACGSESPPPPGEAIECAIGAGAEFSPACTLEKVSGTDQIVLHHPDGGFRRLARNPASGALAALDGAEALVADSTGAGAATFAIGADRYRIPQALLEPPRP